VADDITPIRKPEEIIGEAGGLVDSMSVALCLYSETLDPDLVTQRLGCPPSTSHRKGDRKGPRSPAEGFKKGAWILTVEGEAPTTADELVDLLLRRFPRDEEFWRALCRDYDVQIRFGVRMEIWNRGFDLSTTTLKLMASTGAKAMFDIYYYGTDE